MGLKKLNFLNFCSIYIITAGKRMRKMTWNTAIIHPQIFESIIKKQGSNCFSPVYA